ncbi:methyltransferase domain-containing protein [Streptomyces bambusae]|uniref:class I SAM-dependent methyltransferase n=1 Tax=Streptomyces bambusae TaxID=1550616 RepID=UPI001CFE25E4|nr:class I SAM-dependent methyltransferase [Streptomyces bambusae]MCB5165810.1 methyltransferase domain-containing protein [Streptomyces bambusae]
MTTNRTDHHDDQGRDREPAHAAHAHGAGRGHEHDGPGHGRPEGHAHGHGHGHGHGDGHGDRTELDWEDLADHLESNAEVHLPMLQATSVRLKQLIGPAREVRRILDVGSGPGVMTAVLAETFPAAEVIAVDGARGLLDRALARAARLGLGDRVTVRQADLEAGPGLGDADLIWSSKAVHHLGDQQAALAGLAGALRPGGLLAVSEAGLPMRFLPRDIGTGRPGLQARLDAVQEDWFEEMRTGLPGSTAVVEDWPALLAAAGLTGTGSFTELLDLPAPLAPPARAFLHAQLTRLAEKTSEDLDAEDRKTLTLLTDPDSPRGILHRPDAYLLSAATVFTGFRPAA